MVIRQTGKRLLKLAESTKRMEKREIIARLDKMYRALSMLRYNTYMPEDAEAPGIYDDLCLVGKWAADIKTAWEETHPDYLPGELERFVDMDGSHRGSAIPTLLTVASKALRSNDLPDEIRHSLTDFATITNNLKDDVVKYLTDHQGKLFGVPKELQNEDTLRLLDRCTQNNLLDDHYQPTEEIKPFQLKLIAYAISTTISKKPSWSTFEKLWSLGYSLKGINVPVTKSGEIDKVLRLFPGTSIPTKQQKDLAFICGRSDRDLQQISTHLKESGYISNMAAERDWMVICGKAEHNNEVKPIPWIAELRHLVILVNKLFASCNNEKIWVKTISCFEVNGRTPNIGSLKAANTWLSKNSNYDPNLETIIDNSYENKGVY